VLEQKQLALEKDSYYICDISLGRHRQIDRTICYHIQDGYIQIISYVGNCGGNFKDFYYFKALNKVDMFDI
jgi:hypothetical protein